MRSLHSLHGRLLFINVFTWSHPLQWTLSSFIKWLYLANFSAWFIVEPQKCLWRLIIMHFSSLCRETGRASLKLDAPKQCEFLLFSNCLHLSWHLVCVSVAQLCLTLCESMACSLPDSSVHGVLQARILEWVAISSSRGSSLPRDWSQVSCTAGRFFTVWATSEAQLLTYIVELSHIPFIPPLSSRNRILGPKSHNAGFWQYT